jgi:sporulation protein YlmC with PRC-barrel domain
VIDDGIGMLVRLSDTGQTVADPANDIRGRPVLDESGGDLGTVEDLLFDTERRRIRLLRVVRGGILGFGVKPCYVPVAAVIHAGAVVHVRTSGTPTHASPGYDPDLVPDTSHADAGTSDAGYDGLGFAPYWLPGYLPPPYRPRRRPPGG